MRNYGRLVVELAGSVPDGLVVFFVSYSYMDYVISKCGARALWRPCERILKGYACVSG